MDQIEEFLKPAYFGSADGALGPSDFDTTLVVRLLFDNGLIAPEIFLFISDHVAQHVLEPDITFFRGGLENGLIKVATREPVETFREMLESVKAIKGQIERAPEIAEKLDQVIQRKVHFPWPEGVGKHFEALLRSELQPASDLPPVTGNPAVDKGWDQLWKETADWRFRLIDEAARVSTADDPEAGIRRGDIFELLRQDVLGKEGNTAAAEAFKQWVTECYQANHATRFGARPVITAFGPWSGLLLRREVSSGAVTPQPWTANENLLIRSITLPDIQHLIRMPFKDVLAIRSNEGAAYFEALSDWEKGEENAKQVTAALEAYAKALRKIVRTSAANTFVGVKVLRSPGARAILDALKLMQEPYNKLAVAASLFANIFEHCLCTYSLQETKVELKITRELSLPGDEQAT